MEKDKTGEGERKGELENQRIERRREEKGEKEREKLNQVKHTHTPDTYMNKIIHM